jgi:hypothetical protein
MRAALAAHDEALGAAMSMTALPGSVGAAPKRSAGDGSNISARTRWLADQRSFVTSTASARPYSLNMLNGFYPK